MKVRSCWHEMLFFFNERGAVKWGSFQSVSIWFPQCSHLRQITSFRQTQSDRYSLFFLTPIRWPWLMPWWKWCANTVLSTLFSFLFNYSVGSSETIFIIERHVVLIKWKVFNSGWIACMVVCSFIIARCCDLMWNVKIHRKHSWNGGKTELLFVFRLWLVFFPDVQTRNKYWYLKLQKPWILHFPVCNSVASVIRLVNAHIFPSAHRLR